MKQLLRIFSTYAILICVQLLMPGCNGPATVITDEAAYRRSIADWQQRRIARLKSRTGWLNLAGLYWLEEGENRFGSDGSNDIVFPEKADPFCGTLVLEDSIVTLLVDEGVKISSGGKEVRSLVLTDDHQENTTVLEQGDLAWFILKRSDRFGVRLRDYNHPRVASLEHIPAFPVRTDYVVEASLKPFKEPRTMTVATPVDGVTESYECPGELHFRIGNQPLVLLPFEEGESYFLVFADETTGIETYGSGRFLYAAPDSLGRIILDFNKAYNPPCAFSPYATCPMPPGENFLKVAIQAGEKSVHLE